MAFLIKRPILFIIISIVCLVLIFQFSGILGSKPSTVELRATLSPQTIAMKQNATLTVVLENTDIKLHKAEYHIVGTFTANQLQFYHLNGTPLPDPIYSGHNYTIIYPMLEVFKNLNIGEQRTISVLVKGLDPIIESATYTIFLEVWVDDVFSDRKNVRLTVGRS